VQDNLFHLLFLGVLSKFLGKFGKEKTHFGLRARGHIMATGKYFELCKLNQDRQG
jgi:hypothetical protein